MSDIERHRSDWAGSIAEIPSCPLRTRELRQMLIDAMDAVEQTDDCERMCAALEAFDFKCGILDAEERGRAALAKHEADNPAPKVTVYEAGPEARATCDCCRRPLATAADWERTSRQYGGVRQSDVSLCWRSLGILILECEARREATA